MTNTMTSMTPAQRTLAGNVRQIVETNPERHDQEVFLSAGRDEDGSGIPISYAGLDVEELRNYALLPVPEESQQEDNICKTTGCVAGWTAALAAPKGSRVTEWGVILPGADCADIGATIGFSQYAKDALGINDEAATWLFGAYRSRDEILWGLDYLPDHVNADYDELIEAFEEFDNA